MDDKLGTPDAGYHVRLSPEEVESANLRILSSQSVQKKGGFVIAKERPIEMIFFRAIFTRLREQVTGTGHHNTYVDESIPIEAFQRAFERLFYVLRDPQGFDAQIYDENSNGFVGWGEFCYVFNKKEIKVELTLGERIFITFDDPDSSYVAQVLSVVVLLTIVLSSLCFVLSTAPEFQVHHRDGSEPVAEAAFEKIEHCCLALFIVEYLVRLATCWCVRSEVFDKAKLLELTTGNDIIKLPLPHQRLFYFVIAIPNLIDLAAILPGVAGLFVDMDGGGFVVLRLIRLTRIFRALKNPRILEPVIIIARTLQQSTRALYVLAFNLGLGIVIFGSLMWLAEGGTWDPEDRAFKRQVGGQWNGTEYTPTMEVSPFLSIPHAFWWALVTATTVGYGDQYPTTTQGYLVAVATLVFSLVILALPVGVIGGTFSQVWAEFDDEKQRQALARKLDLQSMSAARQMIDPYAMSNLLLIQVWNERLPSQDGHEAFSFPPEGVDSRPDPAEFLGEVKLELELPPHMPVSKTLSVPLTQFEPLRREVHGHITVQYQWTPDDIKPTEEECKDVLPQNLRRTGGSFPPRVGTLVLTLVCAENLLNLNWSTIRTGSSPYCIIMCCPNAPAIGELVQPYVWRSPTVQDDCSPNWDVSHVLHFNWVWTLSSHSSHIGKDKLRNCSEDAHVDTATEKVDQVMSFLFEMGQEMQEFQEHINTLAARIDHMGASTMLNPERSLDGCGVTTQPSGQPNASPAEANSHAYVDSNKMDSAMPPLPNSIPIHE